MSNPATARPEPERSALPGPAGEESPWPPGPAAPAIGFNRFALPSARDVMAARLRRALDCDELTVSYQPLVELPSTRVIGAEALARWTDAELGIVPPDEFIAVAEAEGLIGRLGRWVMLRACLEATGWLADVDGRLPTVTVNLSAVQLDDATVVEDVRHALAVSGLRPDRLCLEVTETAAIANLEQCAQRLKGLKALGVRLALDDYGTGHSSITMLRRLPFDIVKIDRSFVDRITADALDAVLVRLIIDTAHSLGLRVCAEGVEDEEQARQLIAMGADSAQGWLFGKPEPASHALLARLGNRLGQVRVDESIEPKLVLGGTEELIIVATSDYTIRYISASAKAMLGYAPSEAIGQSVADFLESSQLSQPAPGSAGPGSAAPGELGNGQYKLRHKDGSHRWLDSKAQSVSRDGGDILLIARDVTAAVEAQRAVTESEAKFREAFDGAPIGMAINRLDGTFLDVNHALAELLGYTRSQILGSRVSELTHPDDRGADVANTQDLLDGTVRRVSVDKRYLHADGSALPVRVLASIVTDDESGLAYIVAHIQPR
ncbi:EAL domain-containing protein [Jatrophihabitans telluris]|uniref:EAL domain-containing protein n=1 Tax=Jatrophihabitans telluris TaxID=2038343 RepID=A0ABY4R4M8_9ACTN|nr:EAL domain-containing protein [Jatrophihabitans telluris]UQX90277.1 EAL domain-containing protein [Jatrophihabitans telluris]